MNVKDLIEILQNIDDKEKTVLDNNSQDIVNVHVSTGVIYLEVENEY